MGRSFLVTLWIRWRYALSGCRYLRFAVTRQAMRACACVGCLCWTWSCSRVMGHAVTAYHE